MAFLQVRQQERPFVGGASASHDSPAALAVDLARAGAGVAPGREVLEGEGIGMSEVSVQRRQQRRPTLDDPNPGVGAAVDAALVALGM